MILLFFSEHSEQVRENSIPLYEKVTYCRKGIMKMRAEEKVMKVCNDAGVDIASGTVVLVMVVSWFYNAIRTISEMIINLFR